MTTSVLQDMIAERSNRPSTFSADATTTETSAQNARLMWGLLGVAVGGGLVYYLAVVPEKR